MLMRYAIPLILALGASGASAQMSAEAFEAFTSGKTLTYSVDGQAYGQERYLPNRRVEWSFMDGDCKTGTWYPDAGRICFSYDDWGAPQCWVFTQDGAGLSATFAGDGADDGAYRAEDTGEDMVCLGPKIGV